MTSLLSRLKNVPSTITAKSKQGWTWYRGRNRWQQIAIAALVVALLIGVVVFARSGKATTDAGQTRTVTLSSVAELSGGTSGASIVGTVRSVTEADLLAQAGGTVRSVNTKIGAKVPAGFVIASLDNSSEAAVVLQAEGAYDAAIAARNSQSLPNTQTGARDVYQSAYTAMDTVILNDIDLFFGGATPTGPQLLINTGQPDNLNLGRRRQQLDVMMDAWRESLATSQNASPASLLSQAANNVNQISGVLRDIALGAQYDNSHITPAQSAALSEARATVDGTAAKITGAQGSLRSGSVSATAGADASVKSALGALRGAQAAYEKTRIRATIGGTVNYLPIQVGDYVGAFQHVATVANNGALEIVAFVPQDSVDALSVGMKVTVEGGHDGTITSIAPALDPTTKQVEVHVAVESTPDLVNGQSVRITLPGEVTAAAPTKTASSTPAIAARTLLPLTAVKLLPDSRAVFTVDGEGRVVAHAVTIGDVVGDRIEVTGGLSADMRIITDVRGLSEGQKVTIGGAQ